MQLHIPEFISQTGYFTCQQCSNCNIDNIDSCEYDDFDSTVVCSCKDGYFGTECEHACECNSTGTDRCNINDGTCLCKIGFYESQCEFQCDQCNTDNIYYCTGPSNDDCACLPGYSSDDGCDVDQCPDCFKYVYNFSNYTLLHKFLFLSQSLFIIGMELKTVMPAVVTVNLDTLEQHAIKHLNL